MCSLRTWTLALAAGTLLAAPAVGVESAAAIVKDSGLPGGFCVHLGARDGKLTAELGAGGKFLVHGMALDAASLKKSREQVRARKLYGRVSLDAGSLRKLPYTDNLVNLLVVENAPALFTQGLSLTEAMRVLAPGGAACFEKLTPEALKGRLAAAGFKGVEVAAGPAGWARLVKPRPKEMDEWRHARYSPARTATSRDSMVGPPRQMRWIDAPRRARNHNTRPPGAVSAGGRLFYVFDYGPLFYAAPNRAMLMARDAFSGVVLWKKPIRSGTEHSQLLYPGRTLVAAGGVVYAPLRAGGPLVKMDAATGRELKTYTGSKPDSVIHRGKTLLLLERGELRLVDAASGAQKWTVTVGKYKNRMLVAGDRVYVHVTRLGKLLCLDLARGKEIWTRSNKAWDKRTCFPGFVSGVLIHSGASVLYGLDPKDGSEKWSYRYNMSGRGSPVNVFFSGGLAWVHEMGERGKTAEAWVGIDPKDGKLKRTIPVRFTDKCAPGKATERYLITGRLDFTDVKTGKTENSKAARASCGFGSVPANGMIYTFPTDCRCFPQLKGIMGLGPARAGAAPVEPEKSGQLLRGPAAGNSGPAAGAGDWPVYRRDPERRASTTAEVPAPFGELWSAHVGSRPSAPTVAAGKVFVAAVDAHQVRAFNAKTGGPLWSFTAGGRVDGPPTYYRGLAIFGCGDGRVYCLNASNGKLAWRFRAAPKDMRVIAYGQPASAWPLAGSLPVVDGKVYCAAGRHTGLDGGIFLYALDAASGRVIWKAKPTRTNYRDLLVRNKSWIYMRLAGFDLATGQAAVRRRDVSGFFYSGNSSPFQDDTYAYRTQWTIRGRGTAQLLAFDAERTFGATGYLEDGKYSATRPGKGDYKLSHIVGGTAGSGGWEVKLPIKPRALVLAGSKVFVAGPEDAWPPKGGAVRAYSAKDGKELGTAKLPAAPVFDGMAAANQRLYISTKDGRLRCFGKK